LKKGAAKTEYLDEAAETNLGRKNCRAASGTCRSEMPEGKNLLRGIGGGGRAEQGI